MAPGKIQVVVTTYTMDNSSISLHFVGLGGAGSLQAVQIGHSDGVSSSMSEHCSFDCMNRPSCVQLGWKHSCVATQKPLFKSFKSCIRCMLL